MIGFWSLIEAIYASHRCLRLLFLLSIKFFDNNCHIEFIFLSIGVIYGYSPVYSERKDPEKQQFSNFNFRFKNTGPFLRKSFGHT